MTVPIPNFGATATGGPERPNPIRHAASGRNGGNDEAFGPALSRARSTAERHQPSRQKPDDAGRGEPSRPRPDTGRGERPVDAARPNSTTDRTSRQASSPSDGAEQPTSSVSDGDGGDITQSSALAGSTDAGAVQRDDSGLADESLAPIVSTADEVDATSLEDTESGRRPAGLPQEELPTTDLDPTVSDAAAAAEEAGDVDGVMVPATGSESAVTARADDAIAAATSDPVASPDESTDLPTTNAGPPRQPAPVAADASSNQGTTDTSNNTSSDEVTASDMVSNHTTVVSAGEVSGIADATIAGSNGAASAGAAPGNVPADVPSSTSGSKPVGLDLSQSGEAGGGSVSTTSTPPSQAMTQATNQATVQAPANPEAASGPTGPPALDQAGSREPSGDDASIRALGSATEVVVNRAEASTEATAAARQAAGASGADEPIDELWSQVQRALNRVKSGPEGSELRLRLRPAELGELVVQVRTTGDQLAVRLVTSSVGAQQLLLADQPRLAAELAAAGFDDGLVDISHRGGSDQGSDTSSRQPSHGAANGARGAPATQEIASAIEEEPILPADFAAAGHRTGTSSVELRL